MSHGEAWEFFRLGKYLERACQTARILDVKYHILLPTPQQVGTPVDNAHWVAILTSCSGYEPYHKQRPAPPTPASRWPTSSFSTRCSRARCSAACASARRPPTPSPAGRPTQRGNEVEQSLQDLVDWLDADEDRRGSSAPACTRR